MASAPVEKAAQDRGVAEVLFLRRGQEVAVRRLTRSQSPRKAVLITFSQPTPLRLFGRIGIVQRYTLEPRAQDAAREPAHADGAATYCEI